MSGDTTKMSNKRVKYKRKNSLKKHKTKRNKKF